MSARASAVLAAGALAFVAVLLSASVASACPACAGRNDGGAALLVAYAAMVLAPFAAAYVVARIIKRMTQVETP